MQIKSWDAVHSYIYYPEILKEPKRNQNRQKHVHISSKLSILL